MIASEPIAKARLRIGDTDGRRFSDAEYLDELQSIVAEVCEELGGYVRYGAIQAQEDTEVYDLPEDCLELVKIAENGFENGMIIPASTHSGLLNSGMTPATSQSSPSYWGLGSIFDGGTRVHYRDSVSYNQVGVYPAFSAEDTIVDDEGTSWGV